MRIVRVGKLCYCDIEVGGAGGVGLYRAGPDLTLAVLLIRLLPTPHTLILLNLNIRVQLKVDQPLK